MNNKKRTLLTLEERLALAGGSQVTSPKTAAKLVHQLSQALMDDSFCGGAGFDAMSELMGEHMTCPDEEPLYYGGFCRRLQSAVEDENNISKPRLETLQDMDHYQLAFGAKANNAIVLLGEILLDHSRGLMLNNDIYRCMNMTLGQYLDALTDLSFREDGTLDRSRAEAYSSLKALLLNDYGDSAFLGEALAKMLRSYKDAWREYDHLDHVLRCMGGLACYLEENGYEGMPKTMRTGFQHFRNALFRHSPDLEGRELVDQDKIFYKPFAFYYTLALEYPTGKPELPLKTKYSEIFFTDRDYHPEALRALATLYPSEDFRRLVEKIISGERLPLAMDIVNRIVFYLYVLLVDPYLQIDEYQYKEHLENRPP